MPESLEWKTNRIMQHQQELQTVPDTEENEISFMKHISQMKPSLVLEDIIKESKRNKL